VKLPRDLSGEDLVRLLAKLGYYPTRQTGSHIRLTTSIEGEHHITIPRHVPLKIGTLSGILKDIAGHLKLDKDAVVKRIWVE
jgi:predicted RNA binding protein YcfA (HicA-like mRNA interferase family)